MNFPIETPFSLVFEFKMAFIVVHGIILLIQKNFE